MIRSFVLPFLRPLTYLATQLNAIALGGVLVCSTCFAQNPPPASPQNTSAAQTASASQPRESSSAATTEVKKPKKVWTNDDMSGLNGPVSVVGNSKNPGKSGSGAKADAQYIASVRKQLEKLQAQLDDTDKQLTDLRNFSDGKPPATSGGYQLNKGYNRVPVDQQISNLQDKKKQLEGKIDALLDEARKKGVQPGDLR